MDKTQRITVEGETLELSRGRIKNFYLRVYPGGRACVRAPLRASRAQIEDFVRSRLSWLRGMRARLSETGVPSALADGAALWCFGESFRLRIEPGGKPGLSFTGGEAVLRCALDSGEEEKRAIVLKAYGALLSPYIAERLAYFAPRMGVTYTGFSLRFMSTRWGSCTPATGKMRFNLRLAQKPKPWIDSVVVHELAHLRYPDHSPAFWALVEAHAPDARAIGRAMGKGQYENL